MQILIPTAEKVAERLKARKETVAVAESSAGGLVSAALLAIPGASAYFLGGGVIYTRQARSALAGITDAEMQGIRSSSEPYAQLLARTMRHRHNATWGLSETGAAGPTGNRYGDKSGHTCVGISGPVEAAYTLETGSADRQQNMRMFALEALERLLDALDKQP